MMNWKDIPDIYKGIVVIVALVVGGMTYHDQFAIASEVEEQMAQQQMTTNSQIQYMLVMQMEDKKALKIQAKAKAIAADKSGEAEVLEQEIQTLRDRIKGLCDQLDDC